MNKIKALIFDVDGTLSDNEKEGHLVAFNKAFHDQGLAWNWSVELYGELLQVTGGKERIKHFQQCYIVEAEHLSDNKIMQLHLLKGKYYQAMMARGEITLRPGVERVLREAHAQGLRLAIATTTTEKNVHDLLKYNLDDTVISWFEVIAGAEAAPHNKKPAPDVYNYVLEKMNLRADECVAFEDSENGLNAAQQAGIPTIITYNDYTNTHDFSQAMLVIDHLGDDEQSITVKKGTHQALVAAVTRVFSVDVLLSTSVS